MRELSLFTGTGGGVLGSKLLGWTTVGYVEWEQYCQRVIKQRIKDGIFDNAPIFGDIGTFISEGYARRYRKMVDAITGGFPCQPFSIAGDQLGEFDPRNRWPETAECVRIIRPGICYFENVAALLSSGYFEKILCDLHEMGYNVRWGVLSAGELGAHHRRDRLWILCTDSTISGLERKITESWTRKHNRLPSKCDWWNSESGMGRIDNGTPNRTHRLKALGNAQVPIQMAAAFQALSQGII